MANVVAQAMKDWATSRGALYYAHVFYPLTNATAEKHDGFISAQGDGSVITEFTGKVLVQGEPDGSSFPSGGIRTTFEARGYTAWDVTSPAYLMETPNGLTLCIPTVFVSWTGEALDKKTPLLRSNAAMNRQAQRLLRLLGETEVAPVNSSCGAEQEYFLIDSAYVPSAPRPAAGGPHPVRQALRPRASSSTTTTSAPSPSGCRCSCRTWSTRCTSWAFPPRRATTRWLRASSRSPRSSRRPTWPRTTSSCTMTMLKSTARRHGMNCLLHEKPFAGINGSGKHVNWSVGNATQGNLLDPGSTPHENMQFLLFCGAVIRGVHKYGPLMRAVIATAGNDHRLGANEAPPAIISVYLGSQLEDVFNQIKEGDVKGSAHAGVMQLGVDTLPEFPKDPGDRNRTSPFAFTGNRFEFRAVGSNQSVAGPLVVHEHDPGRFARLREPTSWSRSWRRAKACPEAAFAVLQADHERPRRGGVRRRRLLQRVASHGRGGAGSREPAHHRRCPAGAAASRGARAVRAPGRAHSPGAGEPLRGLRRAVHPGHRGGGQAGGADGPDPDLPGRHALPG